MRTNYEATQRNPESWAEHNGRIDKMVALRAALAVLAIGISSEENICKSCGTALNVMKKVKQK